MVLVQVTWDTCSKKPDILVQENLTYVLVQVTWDTCSRKPDILVQEYLWYLFKYTWDTCSSISEILVQVYLRKFFKKLFYLRYLFLPLMRQMKMMSSRIRTTDDNPMNKIIRFSIKMVKIALFYNNVRSGNYECAKGRSKNLGPLTTNFSKKNKRCWYFFIQFKDPES